ncbi:hypothetical protein PBT90_17025 [Algoriphagus halophytocola]|uniref:Anti-sigma factor n=1 Tax=Algoriphagus halophytocola TaxID=2991499 RepID=A0ABY6MD10_9BACT|nr:MULTISPECIES: hypothetical protein [unclassified Algoriphagus]UZD21229.1 hypothetical protein OM944_11160 [Algoriphagus sp. TR-M5]WBL42440.1 hypothetical protein PBT90_17025 [Algoriphagus sp. TR-M9]
MSQRIEELLEKYWQAESTQAEEAELKSLLKSAPGYAAEKALFVGLEELADEEPAVQMPVKVVPLKSRSWLNWAASVAILVTALWGWRNYEQHQEEQAYQEVMQAFAVIQNNLNKGQQEMEAMNEFKYLNTTNNLFGDPMMK